MMTGGIECNGRRRLATLVGMSVAFGILGCAMDLPDQERIASVRPLALRAEVVGGEADGRVRLEGLPLEELELVPLVVDPQGPLSDDRIATELEPIWLRCSAQPGQGTFGCLSSQLPLALEDLPECPAVTLDDIDLDAAQIPVSPSPCRLAVDNPGRPRFTIPIDLNFFLGGDLEITAVAHRPDEGDSEVCLRALLQQENVPDSCLFTGQRVAVGPDGELLALLEQFGIEDPEQFGTAPEQIPEPDFHPRIESFSVEVFDADDAMLLSQPVERGETLQLPREARIEIEVLAPEEDLQTFLIRQDDDFIEDQELYSAGWFRNWGELLSDESNDPRSINTWEMVPGDDDESDPPGGVATLYFVLRDERLGVTWWWFNVELQ